MMEMLMLACAISQAMAFAPVLPSCSHLAGGRSLHAGCRGGGLQLRASPRRAALLALSMLIEGSAVENVDAGAIKTAMGAKNEPLVLAFCALRCGPCAVLSPQLDLVSIMERGRLRVLKMDTEESLDNKMLATSLKIRALPTILWVSADGKVLQRAEGPLSGKTIRAIAEHRFFDGPEPVGAPQRSNIIVADPIDGVPVIA